MLFSDYFKIVKLCSSQHKWAAFGQAVYSGDSEWRWGIPQRDCTFPGVEGVDKNPEKYIAF